MEPNAPGRFIWANPALPSGGCNGFDQRAFNQGDRILPWIGMVFLTSIPDLCSHLVRRPKNCERSERLTLQIRARLFRSLP